MNVNMKVPIIGKQRVVNFCPRGHVERAPGPFVFQVPGIDGTALGVACCRQCVLEWARWMFPVNSLSPEDYERVNQATVATNATLDVEKSDKGGGRSDGQ